MYPAAINSLQSLHDTCPFSRSLYVGPSPVTLLLYATYDRFPAA